MMKPITTISEPGQLMQKGTHYMDYGLWLLSDENGRITLTGWSETGSDGSPIPTPPPGPSHWPSYPLCDDRAQLPARLRGTRPGPSPRSRSQRPRSSLGRLRPAPQSHRPQGCSRAKRPPADTPPAAAPPRAAGGVADGLAMGLGRQRSDSPAGTAVWRAFRCADYFGRASVNARPTGPGDCLGPGCQRPASAAGGLVPEAREDHRVGVCRRLPLLRRLLVSLYRDARARRGRTRPRRGDRRPVRLAAVPLVPRICTGISG